MMLAQAVVLAGERSRPRAVWHRETLGICLAKGGIEPRLCGTEKPLGSAWLREALNLQKP